MTVTMYRHNKIDGAEQQDPAELARQFVATVRGEENPDHQRMYNIRLEMEYRWFLAGPPLSFAWDEEDWPALWAALEFMMDADESLESKLQEWLTSHLR